MKSKFFQHLPLEKKELEAIWQSAAVVVDTNTLLNLYRWSEATKSEFLAILDEVKDRIWMPHQVGKEYFSNREAVILDAKKSYGDASTDFETLKGKFDAKRGHPHLATKTYKKLEQLINEITVEMKEGAQEQEKLLLEDPTRSRLLELYDQKVGDPFTSKELEKEFDKCKQRYAEQIPPGYKDAKKAEGGKQSDLHSAYGDYLIWRQTMNYAKASKVDVVFITDDAKEDWFKQVSNQHTVGARPELLAEFFTETNQNVAIYKPERFMEQASTFLKSKITPAALEEVRTLSDRQSKNEANINYFRSLNEVQSNTADENYTRAILAALNGRKGDDIRTALKAASSYLNNDEAQRHLQHYKQNLEAIHQAKRILEATGTDALTANSGDFDPTADIGTQNKGESSGQDD